MIVNERLDFLRQKFVSTPFYHYLDMQLIHLEEGTASVKIPFKKELTQYLDTMHGAVITAAADSAVAFALFTLVEPDIMVTTIELKVNYLRPVTNSYIIAYAKILHHGRRIALGDVEIKDENDNLIAKSLATYMILEKC